MPFWKRPQIIRVTTDDGALWQPIVWVAQDKQGYESYVSRIHLTQTGESGAQLKCGRYVPEEDANYVADVVVGQSAYAFKTDECKICFDRGMNGYRPAHGIVRVAIDHAGKYGWTATRGQDTRWFEDSAYGGMRAAHTAACDWKEGR